MEVNTEKFKPYVRREAHVHAKRYEPGDEDGFIADRANGKAMVITKDSKHYEKYAERLDYDTIVPFLYTPSGPLLILPQNWIVVDTALESPMVYNEEEFNANFGEPGRIALLH